MVAAHQRGERVAVAAAGAEDELGVAVPSTVVAGGRGVGAVTRRERISLPGRVASGGE